MSTTYTFGNDQNRCDAIREALSLFRSMAECGEKSSPTSEAVYFKAREALSGLNVIRLDVPDPAPQPPVPQQWEYRTYAKAWEQDILSAELNAGWELAGSPVSFIFDGSPCIYAVLRRPRQEEAAPSAVAAPEIAGLQNAGDWRLTLTCYAEYRAVLEAQEAAMFTRADREDWDIVYDRVPAAALKLPLKGRTND